MHIDHFFKDDKGNVKVFQIPNLLLLVWIVLLIVNIFLLHSSFLPVRMLTTAVIFAWSYNEARSGISMFRKSLGVVVLVVTVALMFIQNG
jgi:hypothetical protein